MSALRGSLVAMVTVLPSRVPGLAAVVLGVALSLGAGAATGGSGGPSAAPPGVGAPTPDPVGVWPLVPAPPPVVTGFDPPATPYGAGHRGVDLGGRAGQPVRSALGGTVLYAGAIAGRGVVVVGHGATRTTYEPVMGRVAVGQPVDAGDRIGVLQLPRSHCFPRACLHWGWIEGETYLDPLRLVGAGPIRLLPLWSDVPRTPRPATEPLAARPTSVGRAALVGAGAIPVPHGRSP